MLDGKGRGEKGVKDDSKCSEQTTGKMELTSIDEKGCG